MSLIDEKGRLFGTINIIDALVIVLIVAVLAAGIALVTGADSQQNDTTANTTVTLEIEPTQQHVAAAIPDGPVETNDDIVAVENKQVEPRTAIIQTEDGELVERDHPTQKTLTLEVTLATTDEDVGVSYLGTPIRIGEELTLDFGTVRVTGNVTDVGDE